MVKRNKEEMVWEKIKGISSLFSSLTTSWPSASSDGNTCSCVGALMDISCGDLIFVCVRAGTHLSGRDGDKKLSY